MSNHSLAASVPLSQVASGAQALPTIPELLATDDLAYVLSAVSPEDASAVACAVSVVSSIACRHDRDLSQLLLCPDPMLRSAALRALTPPIASRHEQALLQLYATTDDPRTLRRICLLLDSTLQGGGVAIDENAICNNPETRASYANHIRDQLRERSSEERREKYLDSLVVSVRDNVKRGRLSDALSTYLELSYSGDTAAPHLLSVLLDSSIISTVGNEAYRAMVDLAVPILGPTKSADGGAEGVDHAVADARVIQGELNRGTPVSQVRRERARVWLGSPNIARCEYLVAAGDLETAYWASIVLFSEGRPSAMPWPGDLMIGVSSDTQSALSKVLIRCRSAQLGQMK
jgi:hypothetical protein